jgi:hypothetical protein
MRLLAVLGKIGIGVSGALLVVACDTPANVTADGSALADTYNDAVISNPCLAGWVIEGMKDNIYENAGRLVTTNLGFNERTQMLVDSAEISFNYITEPVEREDGSVTCSAQADVLYVGNKDTKPDLITQVVKLTNVPDYSRSRLGMGINSYNINQFSSNRDNGFSVNFDYVIGSTYSETGEKSESYNAQIGETAAMLASMIAFDNYTQNEAERRAQAPAELKAMKERIAIKDAEVRAKNLKAQNEMLNR